MPARPKTTYCSSVASRSSSKLMRTVVFAAALAAATGGICFADDGDEPKTEPKTEKTEKKAGSGAYDDGYCDYVQGVASAQSAIQLAPALFGQFGYIEQAVTSSVPSSASGD